MKYNFPIIKNVDDVLPVIEGHEEFGCFDRGGILVANYVVRFDDTFPSVNSIGDAIRRECRGLTFDLESGDIIRRPYHKFFNINEIAETQHGLIDTSEPHIILEKMDGSMISPFLLNDEIFWGSKMGVTEVTEPARKFVEENVQYDKFASKCLYGNYSPIFEWCSRSNRIVIDHPVDRLVLTAVRDMHSGEYWDYEEMERLAKIYKVPVVPAFDSITDVKKFIEHVSGLDQTEGHVMRFGDGHMLKFKSSWYCDIHRAKDKLSSEKKVLRMILENEVDDLMPFLNDYEIDNINRYSQEIADMITANFNRTRDMIDYFVMHYGSQKNFALSEDMDKTDGFHKDLVFRFWGKTLTFDDYLNKFRSIFAEEMLSNRRFKDCKELVFPEVHFYDREDS